MINNLTLTNDFTTVTRWSASREPEQVLILLETLYNAFDQTAKRMGVFKGMEKVHRKFRLAYIETFVSQFGHPEVETIGDVSPREN